MTSRKSRTVVSVLVSASLLLTLLPDPSEAQCCLDFGGALPILAAGAAVKVLEHRHHLKHLIHKLAQHHHQHHHKHHGHGHHGHHGYSEDDHHGHHGHQGYSEDGHHEEDDHHRPYDGETEGHHGEGDYRSPKKNAISLDSTQKFPNY